MVPGTDLPICYEHLNVDIEVLAGKGRARKIVKMRMLIGMVGVERRATDRSFTAAAERLEYVASEEP